MTKVLLWNVTKWGSFFITVTLHWYCSVWISLLKQSSTADMMSTNELFSPHIYIYIYIYIYTDTHTQSLWYNDIESPLSPLTVPIKKEKYCIFSYKNRISLHICYSWNVQCPVPHYSARLVQKLLPAGISTDCLIFNGMSTSLELYTR